MRRGGAGPCGVAGRPGRGTRRKKGGFGGFPPSVRKVRRNGGADSLLPAGSVGQLARFSVRFARAVPAFSASSRQLASGASSQAPEGRGGRRPELSSLSRREAERVGRAGSPQAVRRTKRRRRAAPVRASCAAGEVAASVSSCCQAPEGRGGSARAPALADAGVRAERAAKRRRRAEAGGRSCRASLDVRRSGSAVPGRRRRSAGPSAGGAQPRCGRAAPPVRLRRACRAAAKPRRGAEAPPGRQP